MKQIQQEHMYVPQVKKYWSLEPYERPYYLKSLGLTKKHLDKKWEQFTAAEKAEVKKRGIIKGQLFGEPVLGNKNDTAIALFQLLSTFGEDRNKLSLRHYGVPYKQFKRSAYRKHGEIYFETLNESTGASTKIRLC